MAKMSQQLFSHVAVVLCLLGCNVRPSWLKDRVRVQVESSAVKSIVAQRDSATGEESASLSGRSNFSQAVSASPDSPVSGTSVVFPPGSLAIDMSITLTEGVPVASAASLAALGLGIGMGVGVGVGTGEGNSVLGTAKPVSVISSVAANADRPFTIALSLPSSTQSMAGTYLTRAIYGILGTGAEGGGGGELAVAYRVFDAAAKKILLGIIPRSDLTVADGKLSFKTIYFGTFQPVFTAVAVERAASVAVADAATGKEILTAKEASSLPKVAVHARSPFVVSPGQTVTLRGSNFRPSMLLAVAGVPVQALRFLSGSELSFAAPSGVTTGIQKLSLDQDGAGQSISLLYRGGAGELPVITLPPSDVCYGQSYYDASGLPQSGAKNCGGPDLSSLKPNVLAAGTTVAGVVGAAALESHVNCQRDGQTGCVTTPALTAADVQGLSAWNLRSGTTVGGVRGELKTNCRNAAKSDFFNHDVQVSLLALPYGLTNVGTSVDWWDTLDDFLFPAERVAAWTDDTVCGRSTWSDETTLDAGVTKSTCGTMSTCIYRDKISNLTVTGTLNQQGNATDAAEAWNFDWPQAVSACATSTYGGYGAGSWRLPTQKELMSLYEHGIMSVASDHFLPNAAGLYQQIILNFTWSSTTASTVSPDQSSQPLAYYMDFRSGLAGRTNRRVVMTAICVK